MEPHNISSDIKRFILRSIDSVSHLEGLLLLYNEQEIQWDSKMMAQRLYISEKKARDILEDLRRSGFASIDHNSLYCYNSISLETGELVDQLAEVYSKNLIEITNLIHMKINKQAQKFGDAFKWTKEKD